jgi:hypothetical protein
MSETIVVRVEDDNPIHITVTDVVRIEGEGGGGAVDSVNGQTGVVVLTKADVGLGAVDNTSDANKPVSTATATALSGKAATVHTHAVADTTGLQAALDGKQAAGSYAAASHTHAQSDVTGLTAALAGKSDTGHTHTASQVTDLEEAVEDYIGANVVGTGLISASYNDTSGNTTISTTATANSSDATLLARANHTGTQTASTISDFAETARDTLATALTAGTGITITPNDGADTITIATSGGASMPNWLPPLRSGKWYSGNLTFPDGSDVGATLPNGTVTLHPMLLTETTTFDRIGFRITTAGGGGSSVYVGVYAGAGATLTRDFTVSPTSATSTGGYAITISESLDPGLYWLAIASNDATGAVRTWKIWGNKGFNLLGGDDQDSGAFAVVNTVIQKASVDLSSGLPSTLDLSSGISSPAEPAVVALRKA